MNSCKYQQAESVSEELNCMETMNCLGKSFNLVAVIAIATTGMSTPVMAGTDITPSESNLKLAQSSLIGQCRATKQQIPIFKTADATSEALRLLAANEQVTLAANSSDANGFISISGPSTGFVHAINLKPCSGSSETPPTKELCRQVIRPSQGLLIRREPSTTASQVGSIAYLGRVTLTTNPATNKTVDNRNWVEIALPAKGWVSNGLLTEQNSNLSYCR
jgi:hypothetical protein